MTPEAPRPRSSTSGSISHPRSASRASTTSINTSAEQPAYHYRHGSPGQSAHSQLAPYATKELVPENNRQLANDRDIYAIDPTLQERGRQSRAMSTDNARDTFPEGGQLLTEQYLSYEGKENQSFAAVNDKQTQSSNGGDGQKKPGKGNASSQANDLELRRLFAENKHRDFQDVAASVLANERGPKSEKTKQIFAMNWYEESQVLLLNMETKYK